MGSQQAGDQRKQRREDHDGTRFGPREAPQKPARDVIVHRRGPRFDLNAFDAYHREGEQATLHYGPNVLATDDCRG